MVITCLSNICFSRSHEYTLEKLDEKIELKEASIGRVLEKLYASDGLTLGSLYMSKDLFRSKP